MQICRSPFLIWCTGRTGSTYLCDLLNSHPQIYCRGEDFAEDVVTDGELSEHPTFEVKRRHFTRRINRPDGAIVHPDRAEAIGYLRQLMSQEYLACGFKLKFPNQPVVFAEVVDELRQMPNVHLIGLHRKNSLKQAISLRNLERLRALRARLNSGNSKSAVEMESFELDVEAAVKDARFFRRSKSEFERFAEGFDRVRVIAYEELVESNGPIEELLRFLGIAESSHKWKSKFKKISPDKISDAISNYQELADAVAGSQLEQFLD